MTAIILVVLGLVLVFVIAVLVVGRETHRLDGDAPRPVYDLDEAVAWVAAELPDEVTARLSYGDLRSLLSWSVEQYPDVDEELGDGERGDDANSGPGDEARDALIHEEVVTRLSAKAAAAGLDCDASDVGAVLACEMGYLEVIGAMGPPERQPGDPDAPGPS